MCGNPELRQKIDAMVKLTNPSAFSRRLELLRHEYGHGIKVIEMCRSKLRKFNCYAYALGVWNSGEYQRRAGDNTSETALINSSLIQKMLDSSDFQPTDARAATPGDMLLYFNEAGIQHGAKYLRRNNDGIVVRS